MPRPYLRHAWEDALKSIVWTGDRPVTQGYGCTDRREEPFFRPLDCHFHCGIDVAMPVGTPLSAARGGRVSRVSFGVLAIQVATETDFYVHIDRATVALHQAVRRGQKIAISGDKVPVGGSLTGPHLHFERQGPNGLLNHPATSRDPLDVLTPRFGPIARGGFMPALTDTQQQELLTKVRDVHAATTQSFSAQRIMQKLDGQVLPAIAAATAAITAIQIPAGGLTPEQAKQLAEAKAGLDAANATLATIQRDLEHASGKRGRRSP